MAVAIRGGTPATATDNGTSATISVTVTGTRQPQANDILLIIHCNDFYAASNMPTPTVGGSTTGVNSFTNSVVDAGSNEAHIKAYWWLAASTGDQTISVTETGAHDEEKGFDVYVLSGADTASPIDAAQGTTDAVGSASWVLTGCSPASADAFLIGHVNTGGGGSAGGSVTPPGSMTEVYDVNTGGITMEGATEQLSSSGATGTRTFTPASTGHFAGILIAVKTAAAGGGSVPYNPQRVLPYRDSGETPWLQKDRRNANLVGTAANPLPAPLDTAWQAGGPYWHLYDDWRRPTAPPQQRPYVSDPTLLVAPPSNIPYTPARPPVIRDSGETPWLQPRRPDPALLASALLENELLGGGDTARHYLTAATNADRREYPQQRVYYDTTLLATAQLEDPLLSSAEPDKRAFTPATHAPRAWQPQQQARLADQSSPPPVVLDPTLAAWAVRTLATLLPATHADRREYPQQRIAITGPDDVVIVGTGATGAWWGVDDTASYLGQRRAFDPSLLAGPAVPFDPVLAGWLPLWLAYNRAATHADRREVPQQRAYISDPSFYPTLPPTDPLAVAWGGGGPYWLLYNRAATHVDRRLVPQQQERESDPNLLLSALLEDALLGGWDDRLRRYLVAAWYDRREMPQQRSYPAAQLPDADPLQLLDDARRRYLSPAYYDRREVPQQRERKTLYFDAGPGSPPLTLAWGAGGGYWHMYNRPSRSRPFWPLPQVLYVDTSGPLSSPNPELATRSGGLDLTTTTRNRDLVTRTSDRDLETQ